MYKYLLFFLLSFSISVFANCTDIESNINKISLEQDSIVNKNKDYKQLLELSEASSLLEHLSTFESSEKRSEELSNIFSDNDKTSSTLDIASRFIPNCKPLKSLKKDDLKKENELVCKTQLKSLIASDKLFNKKRTKVLGEKSTLTKKLKESKEHKNIENLDTIKKFLSQKYLKDKCHENDATNIKWEEAYDYACTPSNYSPQSEGIKSFASDNLDVVFNLNLQMNKVSVEQLKNACSDLEKAQVKTPFCIIEATKKPTGELVVESFDEDKKNIETVTTKSVAKKSSKKLSSNKKSLDFHIENDEETRPRRSADTSYFYEKEIEIEQNRKKAKRKKFWKTAGIVTAAAGAGALAIWGLSELFKPSESNIEFTQHESITDQYYTQQYSTNAYQQYLWNQNLSNQYYMMYGSGYMGYPTTSFGTTTSTSVTSTPYTFEYGF